MYYVTIYNVPIIVGKKNKIFIQMFCDLAQGFSLANITVPTLVFVF